MRVFPPSRALCPFTHLVFAAAAAAVTIVVLAAARADQPPAPATREAVVYLKDGHQYTGTLLERTDEKVVLRIAGISATFMADQVDRVKVMPSTVEQFQDLRKAVDDNDVEQLLRLVDWLTARQELDLAAAELDALRERQPESPLVLRAQAMVARQIELRDRAKSPSRANPSGSPPSDRATPALSQPAAVPPLTPEQIALVKVYEIDLKRPPRMEVPRAVMEAALERNLGNPLVPGTKEGREAILKRPFAEQLDLLFRLRARDLYAQVKVLDQPESARLFRDDVQRTWLGGSCSTTACHGGTDAGRLVLSARRPNSDASVYTNMYILERFKLADGTPLIDLESPARSPLLQMGLPRNQSSRGHPPVPNEQGGADRWRPSFRGLDDPRFTAAIGWVNALYRPRPELPFHYVPLRPFDAPDASAPVPGQAPVPGPPR
ncbi:MAG: hypothetical protein ACKVS8_12435 [Phycisphaerales bacterium]